MKSQMNPSLQQPTLFPTTELDIQATVLIVTYNSEDHIEACLDALERAGNRHRLKVVILDNRSQDRTVERIHRSFPALQVLQTGANLGFAAANNLGKEYAVGKYLFLLNPDTRVQPDAFEKAIAWMDAHPDCGLCGGQLLDDLGNVHPSARRFPNLWNKMAVQSGLAKKFPDFPLFKGVEYRGGDSDEPLEVDWVPGAFTGIRSKMLQEIGFFDERFFLYYEETDLCRRSKAAGWKNVYLPAVKVYHEGGGCSKTVGDERFDSAGSQVLKFRLRSECLYHRKHSNWIGVAGHLGFEWLWHQTRKRIHFRDNPGASEKRRYSTMLCNEIARALEDTRWGSSCPAKPW